MFTEESTVKFINDKVGTELVLKSDEFSSYDAEDINYIVEIKNRRKYYPTKLIEASKLFSNYQKSQIKGKSFLYVVTDDKGFYVFNITKNMKNIVNVLPIPLDCPITTDFSTNIIIKKYSYVLNEDLSTKL